MILFWYFLFSVLSLAYIVVLNPSPVAHIRDPWVRRAALVASLVALLPAYFAVCLFAAGMLALEDGGVQYAWDGLKQDFEGLVLSVRSGWYGR